MAADSARGQEDLRRDTEEQVNVSSDDGKSEDELEQQPGHGTKPSSKLRSLPVEMSPAVPGGLNKATDQELVQEIDLLKQQNIALKERCKEIRLNLQRKITELQDTLTISKQKYQQELCKLKGDYGADLRRITRTSEEKQEELARQFEAVKEDELEQLRQNFASEKAELLQTIANTEQKAKTDIEKAEQEKREAQGELKKLKQESTGYSEGGWGTFIMAFEDEGALLDADQRVSSSIGTPSGLSSVKSAGPRKKESKKKAPGKAALDKDHQGSAKGLSPGSKGSGSSREDLLGMQEVEMTHPRPIEKISHFVEVGFLIDRNNFRLLNTFEESTYDSTLKKYLFELQDPINNFQMNDLEFKIKQQLTDNVGLFNDINPIYISLNMGRPASPFLDDYKQQE